VTDQVKITFNRGPRPDKKSIASEHLIDACFEKMSSVYEQYKLSAGDWENNEEILCLEALEPEELTFRL
jgi:hypothetical protein